MKLQSFLQQRSDTMCYVSDYNDHGYDNDTNNNTNNNNNNNSKKEYKKKGSKSKHGFQTSSQGYFKRWKYFKYPIDYHYDNYHINFTGINNNNKNNGNNNNSSDDSNDDKIEKHSKKNCSNCRSCGWGTSYQYHIMVIIGLIVMKDIFI